MIYFSIKKSRKVQSSLSMEDIGNGVIKLILHLSRNQF